MTKFQAFLAKLFETKNRKNLIKRSKLSLLVTAVSASILISIDMSTSAKIQHYFIEQFFNRVQLSISHNSQLGHYQMGCQIIDVFFNVNTNQFIAAAPRWNNQFPFEQRLKFSNFGTG